MTQLKPFCVHPFIRHHVDNQGCAEVCCEAVRQPDDRTPTADWHAPHLQHARRLWLKGQWPAECRPCWQSEQQGARSLRMWTNSAYPRETQWHREQGSVTPPPPVAYDLRMSNLCNMACVMCGSHASSLHHALQQSHHGEADWPTPDARLVDHCVKEIVRNQSHIQHLQFAGGEPMVMPGVLDIIQQLCESGHAQHIHVEFTTNGSVWREQWQDWFDQFADVTMMVSVDAVGELAHRVRPPWQWSHILANIRAIKAWSDQHPRHHIRLGCTVHALTVNHLPELWQWHTQEGIPAWYDRVREPLWLRPQQAPAEWKTQCAEWINTLPDDHTVRNSHIRTNILPELMKPRDSSLPVIQEQLRGIAYCEHTWRSEWSEVMPQLRDWAVAPHK